MKAWKILLTIISTITALALLCSFFPREGVAIGPVSLEFPSISEVLGANDPVLPSETPQELLQHRMEAISDAGDNNYLNYFKSDPARIYFPGEDYTMFDSLFEAFDNASSNKAVKVVHYGDSQIEVDRVSFMLRASLQERFGGMGPGILPLRQEYYNLSIGETADYDPERYMVFGPEEYKLEDKMYGPMCQLSRIDSTITASFFSYGKNSTPSRFFDHITILAGNVSGSMDAYCNGMKSSIGPSDSPISRIRFDLPDSCKKASVTLSGTADIYGIQLEGSKGISLDNVPMRGCSGTVFTSVSSKQLRNYFTEDNVRLIILQYGGNTIPYLNKDKAISEYASYISRQIEHLKTLAPNAVFLFVGPSDMSTNISGKMQTYPCLPQIVEALKTASINSGIAFWNMYEAMGGMNSMTQWVTAQPPLAGSDYVHFTPKGAEKIGEMLSKSLLLYYDYYKIRKENGDNE